MFNENESIIHQRRDSAAYLLSSQRNSIKSWGKKTIHLYPAPTQEICSPEPSRVLIVQLGLRVKENQSVI